jgi:hypothetical protein
MNSLYCLTFVSLLFGKIYPTCWWTMHHVIKTNTCITEVMRKMTVCYVIFTPSYMECGGVVIGLAV